VFAIGRKDIFEFLYLAKATEIEAPRA